MGRKKGDSKSHLFLWLLFLILLQNNRFLENVCNLYIRKWIKLISFQRFMLFHEK